MKEKKFVWLTKGQKEFFMWFLIGLVVIGVALINFSEANSNYEKHGIYTLDSKEIECSNLCEGKKYFYEEDSMFKETVCICGEVE